MRRIHSLLRQVGSTVSGLVDTLRPPTARPQGRALHARQIRLESLEERTLLSVVGTNQNDLFPIGRADLPFDATVQTSPDGLRTTYANLDFPGEFSEPEATAQAFLSQYGKALDIEDAPSELALIEVKYGLASAHSRFQQTIDGIPVFGGYVSVHQGPDGSVQTVHSQYYDDLILPSNKAADTPFETALNHAVASAGISQRDDRYPSVGELVWYPQADGTAVLSWETTVSSAEPLGDFQTVVDATAGKVLWQENLMSFATGTGNVFRPNPYQTQGSGTGLSDSGDANSAALQNQLISVTLQHLDEGTGLLKGEWVDLASLNSSSLPDNDANEPSRVYEYTRDDPRFEQVVIYHAIDSLQTYIHSLGFDDDSGVPNGIRDFATRANAHWYNDDQSFYSTGDDAVHFGDGGVDDGEDGDIILHEYGHAIQHNQNSNWGGGEMGAMGEGFGDYIAASFYADQGDPTYLASHAAAVGEWDATSYSSDNPPNLRRVDGNKMYPDDLVGQVHADGEIWSRALWDIRAALGGPTTDQLVLEHHFTLPAGATMPDAANAILQADANLNGGANEAAIRNAFEDRGILQAPPSGDIFFTENMDADPSWILEGDWAYGTPSGLGGQYGNPDPTSGFTGSNVIGYNLAGDYPNSLPQRWAQTPAIDCSNYTEISLTYQRWLNVEGSTYDHAYVQVSNNGSTWTTVWQNPSSDTQDSSWRATTHDIAAVADGQATVYLRWGMGTTDGSWQFSGWNIDDVVLRGTAGELSNHAPVVTPAIFSVAENSPNTTTVGTISATDEDLPAQNLSYAITAGNSSGAFAINSNTGQISVANAAQLNHEVTDQYALTVQVTDDGSPAMSGTATITVNVTDVNEAPVVTSGTFSIADTSPIATPVGTVSATDEDLPAQNLSFAITAGNGSGAFTINAANGQITVADPSQLDRQVTPQYVLTVEVTDNGSPPMSGTGTITIDVIESIDFGDAPEDGVDFFYPTLLPNGARHSVAVGFSLGAGIDVEGDGQPTLAANGDDTSVGDDEDGVTVPGSFGPGDAASVSVFVTNSAGMANPYLDTWIDFNQDGDWNDSGEHVYSAGVVAGANAIDFAVPTEAALGATYARFRLHDGVTALAPNGPAANGEVEDHLVSITSAATWTPQGPSPATGGQVENISPNDEVDGAIHTVLAHPTNADILYVGATNGGIWKTTNATAASPTWTPLIDGEASLSIGAMQFDPTDPAHKTIVAGIGRYSSYYRWGGNRTGLLRTSDGGTTWTTIDGGGVLSGKNISGVAARGNTIVISVNVADSFTFSNVGIFRSTDGGATFAQVSQGNGSVSGLPGGVAYDLVGDPNNTSVLYTNIVFADLVGGQNGLYKSTDTGASWVKVSDATVDSLITNNTSNIELAVGNHNNVYAAVINNGVPEGFFRSGNGGTTWTTMDTPQTNENTGAFGLNPRGIKGPGPGAAPEELAGGQGSIHFSIVADPNDANIVYVGGDRQPHANEGSAPVQWPNSIGATDFTGRLFRGDASQAVGDQWEHLTHSDSVAAMPGGGTANSSAPHADSREMAFDADGNIIEVDDGGVYRRTSPQDNTGIWSSLIGNLQVTEIHDVAYDPISQIIISGNQDTGTTEQTATGSTTWRSVSTADGGEVIVDSVSLAASNQSIRYSSYQNLQAFRKRVVDAANNVVSTTFPPLAVTSGAGFVAQFDTPIALNAVDPSRLMFGGANGLYESLNQGNTMAQVATDVIATGGVANPIAYGGRSPGGDNPNVVYAGSSSGDVYVRTTSGGSFTATDPDPSGGGMIYDVRMDPAEWNTAFAVDNDQVFMTTTAAASWSDITGNLLLLGAHSLRSLEFVSGSVDAVVVGSGAGIFVSLTSTLGTWFQLGADLPNAPVWDLDYDPTYDVLVAGMLGRGAWTLGNASSVIDGTDINESPQVTSETFSLAENSPVATIVGTVSATDPGAPPQTLTYAIMAGNDAGAFTIDSATGQIAVANATQVNHELTAQFILTIQVTDNGSPPMSGTGAITINVTDVNESPLVLSQSYTIAESSPNTTPVGTVSATDEDLPTQTLSYAITAGNSSGTFTIDSGSGQITVDDASQLDHQTTPQYVLTVEVTDNGTPAMSGTGTITIDVIESLDFGDAPDPNYPTLRNNDGARHVTGNLYLGAAVDRDADGRPNPAATGDDDDGYDDEDGIAFTSSLLIGDIATLEVTASAAGKLDAWIDFNGDGDWADPGEQIFSSQTLSADVNALSFAVPADALALDRTYARFRLSSAGGLSYAGKAADGEVEDYAISIQLAAPILADEPVSTVGTENTITWSAVAGAEEYYAEYDNQPDFSSPEGNSGWITGTQHTFVGLTEGQSYYYRVKARQEVAPIATLFHEDFEDGDYLGWLDDGMSGSREVTNATAAGGSSSLQITGATGHFLGVSHALAGIKPDRIDFSVRSADTSAFDGYFVVGAGPETNQTAVMFGMTQDGMMGVYDGTSWHVQPYDTNTWYDVAFEFDWTANTIDFYVDDGLVGSGVPFRADVANLTNVYLYNPTSSQAWWDEIEFLQTPAAVQVESAWSNVESSQQGELDYGDAPDTGAGTGAGNYNTLATDNGPRHVIVAGLYMGTSVDGDTGALQNATADADDSDQAPPDDEDGLNSPTADLAITVGIRPAVNVIVTNTTGSAATLSGWIDYDNNGLFDNATERAQVVVPDGTSGAIVTLAFPSVPEGYTGTTYARFRLSTDAAAENATAGASDGEVEDYVATIVAPPNDPPTVALQNTTTTLPEDINTSNRIKVADIVVTDDAVGTNELSLTGNDAALFEIDGTELFLIAGAALDFETNPQLDVIVEVDDINVGATPDDTAALLISVTDVFEPQFDDLIGRVSNSGDWYVARSDGTAFTTEKWGRWSPNVAWSDVHIGDFTGDGKDDVVGRTPSGDWYVARSDGTAFTMERWGKWSPNVTWEDIQIGDFTGDGKDDLVGRVSTTGDWWVATSSGDSFSSTYWGKWSPNVTWEDIRIGDFTGDGKDDLAGRVGTTGDWYVATSNGTAFTSARWGKWSPNVTWENVMVGDFSGDGSDDLVARVGTTGHWYVATSSAGSFSTASWGVWSPNVTWQDIQVGDFSGDGRDDLVARVNTTGDWYVATSSGDSFSTTRWGKWSPNVNWENVQIGDFTGDGKDDLVGRVVTSGDWYVAKSNGTAFTSSRWGTWSPNVTWVDIQVGNFDGTGSPAKAPPKTTSLGAAAAADQFWSDLGDGDNDEDSLALEPVVVDLLKMEE